MDYIPAAMTDVDNNNGYSFREKHFPKRPALDLSFDQVKYGVTTWNRFRPERKEILHGVSGEFRSGELTGIMGPSGAGKSTLLNILAAFTLRGSSGEVCVNGQDRGEASIDHFRRISCYIQQDDELRPLLTVRESMTLASHLKLGRSVSLHEKKLQITELLQMLGLEKHGNTMSRQLSGGQKKRLSIALELITNPPLIFLDEPTTGLDSSSTRSCISLLKDLARQGRTVVCTIHQPSALLFEMFDQLYAVAQGRCIYQGPVRSLVPFLAAQDLCCPSHYNPADFLIEVASGEYGCKTEPLAQAAEILRLSYQSARDEDIMVTAEGGLAVRIIHKMQREPTDVTEYSSCQPKPASLLAQCFLLYNRNLQVLRRSMTQIVLRLAAHILIALLFGYLYRNVGTYANSVFANYIYVYGTILFLHYTGQMAVLLAFPLEFKVLTREHFNRWYSLASYCLALVLVEIPFQVLCSILYLCCSYYLTGQPLEWSRFSHIVLLNVSISFTSQATGFLAGAILPITVAVFIAPVSTAFLSVFGFASRYSDMLYWFRGFYSISYFRIAYHGCLDALYGYARAEMPCQGGSDLEYCHYKDPAKFMRDMEVTHTDIWWNFSAVTLAGVLCYVLTIATVWYKLNRR